MKLLCQVLVSLVVTNVALGQQNGDFDMRQPLMDVIMQNTTTFNPGKTGPESTNVAVSLQLDDLWLDMWSAKIDFLGKIVIRHRDDRIGWTGTVFAQYYDEMQLSKEQKEHFWIPDELLLVQGSWKNEADYVKLYKNGSVEQGIRISGWNRCWKEVRPQFTCDFGRLAELSLKGARGGGLASLFPSLENLGSSDYSDDYDYGPYFNDYDNDYDDYGKESNYYGGDYDDYGEDYDYDATTYSSDYNDTDYDYQATTNGYYPGDYNDYNDYGYTTSESDDYYDYSSFPDSEACHDAEFSDTVESASGYDYDYWSYNSDATMTSNEDVLAMMTEQINKVFADVSKRNKIAAMIERDTNGACHLEMQPSYNCDLRFRTVTPLIVTTIKYEWQRPATVVNSDYFKVSNMQICDKYKYQLYPELRVRISGPMKPFSKPWEKAERKHRF